MEPEGGTCRGHVYMQCMKNQSATLGTYTVDGCGEFLPSEINGSDLFCSACGCHRSFHRKVLPSPSYIHPPPLYSNNIQNNNSTTQKQLKDLKPSRRARTKFTEAQKEKMGSFAERIGWLISNTKRERQEEEEVDKFLEESGVSRRAFKVWMHNHRNNVIAGGQKSNQVTVGGAESSGTETDDSGHAAIVAAVSCGSGQDEVDEIN